MQYLKLVSVGDAGVGKTLVFKTYMEKKYDISWVPSEYGNDTPTFIVDGQKVNVGTWDLHVRQTIVSPDLPPQKVANHHCPYQRYLRYPYTGAFLICFSVDDHASFKNVEEKWIPEVQHYCPDVPFVIVACKIGSAPMIEIERSTFGDDWHRALQDPRHSDVTFVLEDKHRLQAHSVMLSSASKVFAKVFGLATPTQECNAFMTNQLKQINAIESYSREQINTGAVPGFAAIYDKEPDVKDESHVNTVIEMSADISAKTFIHVLEFLYSGVPQFTEDAEDIADDEVRDLDRVAALLKLSQLQTICSNILTDQDFLNPSIDTFLNDETGARMKELFFNKEEKADVVFLVEGEEVYGHKCVLTARCQVMAAMFSGHFAESKSGNITKITVPNTTHEVFLALLEYLYTDHAPIEDGDPVGIMLLSDEYGQRRLTNLCELYITKEIDRSVTKRIETTEIDVIGLLFTAHTLNADQLAKWCLFFIASNYMSFEKTKEFHSLKGNNKDYVEENRWPPVSYLTAMEEYQKKYGDKKEDTSKCVVM